MAITPLKEKTLTVTDHSALVKPASVGQYSKAIILFCVDSRVSVEDISDKSITIFLRPWWLEIS
jgi:hypothetical protein